MVFSPSSAKWSSGGDGTTTGGHAACEIYYPIIGEWVRCDPAQHTVNFGKPQFVKLGHGIEDTTIADLSNFTMVNIGNPYNFPVKCTAPTVFSPTLNSTPYTSTFTAIDYEPYTTYISNNKLLFTIYKKDVLVGIHDEVHIQDPPPNTPGPGGAIMPPNTTVVTPCSKASFYAKFTTGSTPPTYDVSYDWSIILYYSGGTYMYAQRNGVPAAVGGYYWAPTPGALPLYNWLYDPSGNIFAKVKVTVHISDGDTKTDEVTIGVSPYNYIKM